jgi:DNA end-binding protein Ku
VAADTDSAIAKAAEVLAFHVEGLAEDGVLPRPRSLSELKTDPSFCEDAKDGLLVLVPYEPPSRAVRVNVTLEESLLARIDRSADALNETRSGYLAVAARLRMEGKGGHATSKSNISRDNHRGIVPAGDLIEPWKGHLKLSLVSCAISLFPASSKERVSFVQINRKTGNPLQHQIVDSDTGEAVDSPNRARGYEIKKGEFVLVEDDRLAAFQIDSKHTIEIEGFVPRAQIDLRYLDIPYYIRPDDNVGLDAFAVIREAMRGKDTVALARIVMSDRERVMALEPFGKGLMGITLRYGYQVRDADECFRDIPDIKVAADMVKLAEHIVDVKKFSFDPSRLEDRYEFAFVEMLKRTQTGRPAKSAASPSSPSNVISLMDALKRSIQSEQKRRDRGLPNQSGQVQKSNK